MRAAKSLPATIFITLLMGMLSCGAAMAAGADDLYRTRTTVTGQGETNRLIGFAVCLEQVLIIHGLGTGALRDAVRSEAASHPLVKSVRAGERGEGGDGASILTL